ncbi:hypothetical protein K435DRAFT_117739 [Dendrothele bispora CBS 962.96]|uniref:DUF6534 domain-containing protein n=1 Tax=Dendrothele bispora (strain CBS 962.96) TaxID=1314807 RepID=A0A4S8MQY5_DENBC|nr:hypothetical protein K435DRAFT_117739 [Dendrothele bispora CBS 962.96]
MSDLGLNDTYGSAFIGLVVSAILYGVTVLQTFLYFRNYPRDRLAIKIMVLALWLLDTCHLVLCTIAIYWYLVTNFSHKDALMQLTWSMELQTDCNGLIGLIVECFFAHRVLILSKNKYLTAVIVLLACIHFGLGILFTVKSFEFASMMMFQQLIWVTGAGIGSAAAADILIAGSLVYYLSKTRTGFQRTDSLITLLIIYSVTTGVLTSILDLIIIATFSTMPNNYIWLAFFWVAGKCYVNSLLAALNGRVSLREKAAPIQGSFLQFSPLGNDISRRSGNLFPTPFAVSIQRDTLYTTDYPEPSASSAISKLTQKELLRTV